MLKILKSIKNSLFIFILLTNDTFSKDIKRIKEVNVYIMYDRVNQKQVSIAQDYRNKLSLGKNAKNRRKGTMPL